MGLLLSAGGQGEPGGGGGGSHLAHSSCSLCRRLLDWLLETVSAHQGRPAGLQGQLASVQQPLVPSGPDGWSTYVGLLLRVPPETESWTHCCCDWTTCERPPGTGWETDWPAPAPARNPQQVILSIIHLSIIHPSIHLGASGFTLMTEVGALLRVLACRCAALAMLANVLSRFIWPIAMETEAGARLAGIRGCDIIMKGSWSRTAGRKRGSTSRSAEERQKVAGSRGGGTSWRAQRSWTGSGTRPRAQSPRQEVGQKELVNYPQTG